jgi:hypothetical protein
MDHGRGFPAASHRVLRGWRWPMAMTWREFKRQVDRLIIEGGGDPNTIELNHIDFGASAVRIECWLGEPPEPPRLQIWSVPR